MLDFDSPSDGNDPGKCVACYLCCSSPTVLAIVYESIKLFDWIMEVGNPPGGASTPSLSYGIIFGRVTRRVICMARMS